MALNARRGLRPEEVTAVFSREQLTAWMSEMPADELAPRPSDG